MLKLLKTFDFPTHISTRSLLPCKNFRILRVPHWLFGFLNYPHPESQFPLGYWDRGVIYYGKLYNLVKSCTIVWAILSGRRTKDCVTKKCLRRRNEDFWYKRANLDLKRPEKKFTNKFWAFFMIVLSRWTALIRKDVFCEYEQIPKK